MSQIFEEAFGSMEAGCWRACACGKVYYDVSCGPWDWEDDEFEGLEKDLNAYPVDHAVGGVIINGEFLVFDCACGKAEQYENFIIGHERQLAEYLNARARKLEKEARMIKIETAKGASLSCPVDHAVLKRTHNKCCSWCGSYLDK